MKFITSIKEDNIGFLTGRTHQMMRRVLFQTFQEAGYDVTLEQWIILKHLWYQDGLSQQFFADGLLKDKSSMARLIANMEKKNIVKRIASKEDRRNKLIYLTEHGRTLQENLQRLANNLLKTITNNIDTQEMDTCKKVLSQVFENAMNIHKSEV